MIGVRKGFGRYLAEVSHGARAASAEALGARGRTGSPFPGFRGPVGEGRRCYSQPRVARLRLLGRARVDETSQVRVVAIYPGGYIGSIDVSVGGRGGAIPISSTPAPVARARRVVTIPVHFTRRGATGLDVTAEGLPLSRRCGDRPLLRHSAPKTLVVQVRQRPHAHGLIGCYRASPEMSPRPCKQARRYPARGVPVLTESRRFTYRRRFRKSLIAVVRSARIGDTSGDGIAAEGSPSAREQPARV
jgi:hypothetical protein